MSEPGLVVGDDGIPRCPWAGPSPDYVAYHDMEWGRPVADDHRLFEKLCLEGFQAGLSWLTILHKREAFRKAFALFDPAKVARTALLNAASVSGLALTTDVLVTELKEKNDKTTPVAGAVA